jgi:hypothetical protein
MKDSLAFKLRSEEEEAEVEEEVPEVAVVLFLEFRSAVEEVLEDRTHQLVETEATREEEEAQTEVLTEEDEEEESQRFQRNLLISSWIRT